MQDTCTSTTKYDEPTDREPVLRCPFMPRAANRQAYKSTRIRVNPPQRLDIQ